MSLHPSTAPDDIALLRAVASRDEDTFQRLYERYAAPLFALALRILGDRADAEDVLEEMFIQVWRTAGAFDERRGQPLGWLIMLTRSRAIDRLRSRPTRARATEAGTLPVPESAAESYPAIRRAVGSLPEEQRSLIELAYFGGLTQSEIARRVGQPLDTVRTRICTGMIRLREQLGETTGTQREGAAR